MEATENSRFSDAIDRILTTERRLKEEFDRSREETVALWQALEDIKKICDEAEHHTLRLIGKICEEKLAWITRRADGEI